MEKSPEEDILARFNISDEDIYEAMKDIEGFLDITPGDFRELYVLALRHAVERLTMSVLARDIMTREVHTAAPEMPLKEVAEILSERGVAGLPVVGRDGKVSGVISEKDFLASMAGQGSMSFMGVVAECLKGKGCLAVPVRAQRAADIMSSPAICVNQNTRLMEIADLMAQKNINRVPIIDAEGMLTGIISRADIIRTLGVMAP